MTSPDIFVSYTSSDRAAVELIVAALESADLEVWWDRDIATGHSFDRDIEAALEAARCVVVVWSRQSVESDWVRAEATEGLERGTLIPVALDDVRPPLAFRRVQTLKVRPGVRDDLQKLVASVFRVLPDQQHATEPGPASSMEKRRGGLVIVALLVIGLAIGAWNIDWGGDPDAASSKINSLAVLPLTNLMNDPGQAYFVQGMHEALITELSKIEALHVISRTSAMKYQGSDKSVPEIADELGVDAIIEGSVLRSGDTVRVTAQLIEADTDRHLWADNFDRELTDILSLYADVTRAIVDQIRVEVTPNEAARLASSRSVDPTAYELYLKGKYFCDIWAPKEMEQGIDLMRLALVEDPRSADAHAGLAICLQYAAFFDYLPAGDVFAEAVSMADRAVELDDQLAEAWVALAAVHYYLDYDGPSSERALKRALELNPGAVRALIHQSWQLGEAGRLEESLGPSHQAILLDPLSVAAHGSLAQTLYLNGDNEKALGLWQEVVEMDRRDPSSHYYLGLAREQNREYDKAIASHLQAVDHSDGEPLYVSGLGHAYGVAGRTVEARELLRDLVEWQEVGRAQPFHVAFVHLGLKNFEQAIDWLEMSYEARNPQLLYVKQGPQFDPLRQHERFNRLVERIRW
jgi:TolB-like protein/Flp pilus assembly protein TadD